ncbi:het domain-containing protein [Colletotrichum musicola]|uniref:Het domain-containing protein n=1 Tax=Colletotrichum musicola TaxID=2175873 RepID=A0A8H6NUL3_9PEZI|nr:het domain-containing protein [Colletotrichum musicola]
MPCPTCNDFVGTPWNRTHRNHIKSGLAWVDLVTSAQTCYPCDVLLRGIRGCFSQHKVDELQVSSLSIDFLYRYRLDRDEEEDIDKEIRFWLADGTKFEISIFWAYGEEHPIPDSWEEFPAYYRTSPRTDSQGALKTALAWIEECRSEEHTFCEEPDEATLPSRVVDVGLDTGVVRLVQTQGDVARYVALSHCWGKTQIITTTRNTLPDRLSEIPIDQLSNTFRDAVFFTRRMGIRYIWIDSLCIIQDDLADWEVESAKMMDVYSNAYLTIAATNSINGDGGLFRETPDFEVAGTTPLGEPHRLFFRQRIDHHLEGNFDSDFDASFYAKYYGYPARVHHPLFTRGWVWQERLLSGRVLHFGLYELFWECRNLTLCECSAIGHHGSSDAILLPDTKRSHADALGSYVPGVEWHEIAAYYMAQVWRTMVSSYTCLGLTKRSDSLPAMGGLAKHMGQRRRTRYLAGLWENSLSDDLTWHVRNPAKKPRPEPRPAPTWSWASVDSFVSYFDEVIYGEEFSPEDLDEQPIPTEEDRLPFEHFSRVEDCWVRPSAVDEYGAIAEGRVTLRGLVSCGTLRLKTDADDGGREVTHYFQLADGSRFPVLADYLLDSPGPDHVPDGAQVWCLRMSQIQMGHRDSLFSLVLRQADTATQAFERIGSLMTVSEPPVETVGILYRSAKEVSVTIV